MSATGAKNEVRRYRPGAPGGVGVHPSEAVHRGRNRR